MQISAIPLATFQVFSYLRSMGSQWVKGDVRGVPGARGTSTEFNGDVRGVPTGQRGSGLCFPIGSTATFDGFSEDL